MQQALRVFDSLFRLEHHGAIKVLHKPADGSPLEEKQLARMTNEVRLYQGVSHPNLLRLIEADLEGGWLVTEYQRRGTLARSLDTYRGRPLLALERFVHLVEAVGQLHAAGGVHRDIKPENIFVAFDERLVLGDGGIVFFNDDAHTRVSGTLENVGSRDWMPLWANGRRIEDLRPTFDLYALGKVLWSMISGRPKLTGWYYDDEEFDLAKQFPEDPSMKAINILLSRSVREREKQIEQKDAGEYLNAVKDTIAVVEGMPYAATALEDRRRCIVCRLGTYVSASPRNMGIEATGLGALAFHCNRCGHIQAFIKGTLLSGT
jgi:serine/threonine protein kinase